MLDLYQELLTLDLKSAGLAPFGVRVPGPPPIDIKGFMDIHVSCWIHQSSFFPSIHPSIHRSFHAIHLPVPLGIHTIADTI
jgi:hypothetical protein